MLAAEVLDVGLHELDSPALSRLILLNIRRRVERAPDESIMRGCPRGGTFVMMAEATHLRLALAQINPVVGDIDGNVEQIRESIERARDGGAQLVVLPELCLSGYPPEDLVLAGTSSTRCARLSTASRRASRGSPRWSGFRSAWSGLPRSSSTSIR